MPKPKERKKRTEKEAAKDVPRDETGRKRLEARCDELTDGSSSSRLPVSPLKRTTPLKRAADAKPSTPTPKRPRHDTDAEAHQRPSGTPKAAAMTAAAVLEPAPASTPPKRPRHDDGAVAARRRWVAGVHETRGGNRRPSADLFSRCTPRSLPTAKAEDLVGSDGDIEPVSTRCVVRHVWIGTTPCHPWRSVGHAPRKRGHYGAITI